VPAALNATFLSITDAWGYYKGVILSGGEFSGGTEDSDLDTSGNNQNTDDGSWDTSGGDQDTGYQNTDSDSQDGSMDASGSSMDTTAQGMAIHDDPFSCNIPSDPRREMV
jgi:hypothetical protein